MAGMAFWLAAVLDHLTFGSGRIGILRRNF
jgi:hypothetical protein